VRKLVFTDQAEADLEAIGDYIAFDSPFRAVTFIQELPRLSGFTLHAGAVSTL